MKWGRVSHVGSQDATATAAPVLFRSRRSAAMSGPAKPTVPTLKPDGEGLLILSHKMRQDAFRLDRDKALRGNRKEAGRIEAEARKATTAILGRGV